MLAGGAVEVVHKRLMEPAPRHAGVTRDVVDADVVGVIGGHEPQGLRKPRVAHRGDVGGLAGAYEVALGWDPASQDHNGTVSGATFFPEGAPAGYTRLEEYLHFMSVPHVMIKGQRDASVEVDLSRYTSGFTKSAVFKVTAVTGGTVVQGGNGGRMLRFKPNQFGRGGFLFTVTDGDGDSWDQQFLVCVTKS